MAKHFTLAALALMLFAGMSFAEVIIYSVIVDTNTNNFSVFVRDVAPTEGQDSNGGISGFSIIFTPNVDSLEIARLQGDVGSTTGFDDPDPADENVTFGIGTDMPNLFGGQFGSGAVFGFGQEAGVIPNSDVSELAGPPHFFDGDIAFEVPAYLGRGHFTGSIQDFGVVSTRTNVYADAGNTSVIREVPDNQVLDQIEIVPEPTSLAILLGGGVFVFARRRLS
jgi:hypothetical protein